MPVVRNYFERAIKSPTQWRAWASVLDEAEALQPEAPARIVLRSPLNVWLLRTICRPGAIPPMHYLAGDFDSAEAIQRALLDELIPTVYDAGRRPRLEKDGWAPWRTRGVYTEAQARRLLSYVAKEMQASTTNKSDLA